MELKNVNKALKNSLNFLDNQYIYSVLVIILVLYNSLLFTNINNFVGNIYNFGVVRVLVLILILYVVQKDVLLGILLAMSYLLSTGLSSSENFQSMVAPDDEEGLPEAPTGTSPNPVTSDDTEPFIPSMIDNAPPVKSTKLRNAVDNVNEEDVSMTNSLSNVNCLNNYTPNNEGVGNVCSSMDTYNNEYNTQGLNYPIGFDKEVIVGGSKLNPK